MEAQNYANHRRYVPLYHGLLSFLLIITFIGSLVNTYLSFGDHQRIYSASLITVLTFCGTLSNAGIAEYSRRGCRTGRYALKKICDTL